MKTRGNSDVGTLVVVVVLIGAAGYGWQRYEAHRKAELDAMAAMQAEKLAHEAAQRQADRAAQAASTQPRFQPPAAQNVSVDTALAAQREAQAKLEADRLAAEQQARLDTERKIEAQRAQDAADRLVRIANAQDALKAAADKEQAAAAAITKAEGVARYSRNRLEVARKELGGAETKLRELHAEHGRALAIQDLRTNDVNIRPDRTGGTDTGFKINHGDQINKLDAQIVKLRAEIAQLTKDLADAERVIAGEQAKKADAAAGKGGAAAELAGMGIDPGPKKAPAKQAAVVLKNGTRVEGTALMLVNGLVRIRDNGGKQHEYPEAEVVEIVRPQ